MFDEGVVFCLPLTGILTTHFSGENGALYQRSWRSSGMAWHGMAFNNSWHQLAAAGWRSPYTIMA